MSEQHNEEPAFAKHCTSSQTVFCTCRCNFAFNYPNIVCSRCCYYQCRHAEETEAQAQPVIGEASVEPGCRASGFNLSTARPSCAAYSISG